LSFFIVFIVRNGSRDEINEEKFLVKRRRAQNVRGNEHPQGSRPSEYR